jgi:hypothetical protein
LKTALVRNVLLSAGLVSSAFVLGVYWSLHAGNALNGLRSAGPFTHEEEAAFIRSRVLLSVVPPEWVSGVESNELIWIKYEMLARCGLTIAASVAIIFTVRFVLRKKNEKPA